MVDTGSADLSGGGCGSALGAWEARTAGLLHLTRPTNDAGKVGRPSGSLLLATVRKIGRSLGGGVHGVTSDCWTGNRHLGSLAFDPTEKTMLARLGVLRDRCCLQQFVLSEGVV